MDHVIRGARPEDSEAIGLIHVRAWQAAYRGVMPDGYLDALRVEDRAVLWQRAIEEPRPRQRLRVVVVDDAVAGFAVSGPEAGDLARETAGELYAINLDPRWWGKGLGRALLREVTSGLADSGYTAAVLWVTPANERARNLYESEGWATDGTNRDAEVLGAKVLEVRYQRALSDP